MQRELKFRAWDADTKQFVLGNFSLIGEVTLLDITKQYQLENAVKLEITQYTGLKDKNGKEIYEGDIVNIIGIVIHQEIRFENGAWCACNKNNMRLLLYEFHNSGKHIEVMGNIYENPELIS